MQKGQGRKGNNALNIISVILCVLFIPIILVNTILIVKTYTESEHIPDVFGIKPVIVLSGSMSPAFETNSLIFVKEKDNEKLEVGEVICFISEDNAITHRIEEVTEDEEGQKIYITKGDANNTADRLPVYEEQIEGVYIGHINKVGGFAMFMQSTTGMIIFIVVPILLYFGWDIFRRSRESKKEKIKTAELEAQLASLKDENPTSGQEKKM